MKQILQNLKTGNTVLAQVPSPQPKSGHIVIQTKKSLISPGTERMLVGIWGSDPSKLLFFLGYFDNNIRVLGLRRYFLMPKRGV